MTDQELLTYAAKAAKIFVTPETWPYSTPITAEDMETYFDQDDLSITGTRVWFSFSGEIGGTEDYTWNPLCDDADAFQLMVKLSIRVHPYVGNGDDYTTVTFDDHDRITLDHNDDAMAATRRAIVMAAAEIGKGM